MSATTEAISALPRWHLDNIFPGPESPALRTALSDIAREAAFWQASLDTFRDDVERYEVLAGELKGNACKAPLPAHGERGWGEGSPTPPR